ncbi:MAG: hypothetical protein ABIB71_08580 [Candidatus Woesearchaeota archaeon]
MSLIHDIGKGMLGIVLIIVAFIILMFGGYLIFFGHWIIGLIVIIVGCGIAIASRQRIHGH